MKNEIMTSITGVINALNNITVNGKKNLSNLVGSITILEEVYKIVSDMEDMEKIDTTDTSAPIMKAESV